MVKVITKKITVVIFLVFRILLSKTTLAKESSKTILILIKFEVEHTDILII